MVYILVNARGVVLGRNSFTSKRAAEMAASRWENARVEVLYETSIEVVEEWIEEERKLANV